MSKTIGDNKVRNEKAQLTEKRTDIKHPELHDVESVKLQDPPHRWSTGKILFFFGFFFPPAWFLGSTDCSLYNRRQEDAPWKKRCRIAATLCLTAFIVTAALVMIFSPQTFGLRTSTTGPETQSSSDTAVRPGVPGNASAWGNTAAGVSINDKK